MKKWLIALFILTSASAANSEQFSFSNMRGGQNSFYDPLTIGDDEVQEATDVLIDQEQGFVKPNGFSVCGSSSSYSFDSLWWHKDGSGVDWMMAKSSTSIIAGNTPCEFDVHVATVAAVDTVNMASLFGSAYFVDQTQGLYVWNGTSTTYVSSAPHGKLITDYRGRAWIAGLPFPNGNQLYGSQYLNGRNYTTGSLATDAVILTVGLNDPQQNITCIASAPNDAMIVFKKNAIYGVYGFDQTDFQVRILNSEVGCIDQRSVRPYQNGLVFASERGVEYFNGVSVQLLSDKIQDKTETFSQSSQNLRSWTQTSQGDWEEGVIDSTYSLSTTISIGDIVPSSYTSTQSTQADWIGGVRNNLRIDDNKLKLETCSNSPLPATSCGLVTNNSFETNDFTGWDTVNSYGTWSTQTTDASCVTLLGSWAAYDGTYFARLDIPSAIGAHAEAQLIDTSGNVLGQTNSWLCGACSWASIDLTLSPAETYINKRVKFRVSVSSSSTGGTPATITSADSYPLMNFDGFLQDSPRFFFRCSFDNTPGAQVYMMIDAMVGRYNNISSGTYQSPNFDTGMDHSYMRADVDWTVNDATPTFVLQDKGASDLFFSDVTTSTGTNVKVRRYVRYLSTFTFSSSQDYQSYISSVTLVSRSTGTFYSSVFHAPGMSSWDTLNASYADNGGSHTFAMRASTSPFTITSSTPSWTTVTPNLTITISTGAYFQVRDQIDLRASTNTPTLSQFTVNWNEGTLRPPMASIVYRDRYYLAVSTNTSASANDTVLVLSKTLKWSLLTYAVGAMSLYRDSLYHTNTVGNGKVYLDDIAESYSYDGEPIRSSVTTKEYVLGDITKTKLMDSLYVISKAFSSSDISVSYALDRDGFISLASVDISGTGLKNERLLFPISTSQPNFGKTVSFKFSNGDNNEGFGFIGGILNYRSRMTE